MSSIIRLGLLLLLLASASGALDRAILVEDFESGSVILESYPGQDQDPGDWGLTASNTYEGSDWALRIYGNTWKTQAITPRTVDAGTVWEAALYVDNLGEMQAFGVGDGVNELIYTVAGEDLPEDTAWWTVYQGAFPHDEWVAYLLPIGRDWYATYGYYPVIDKLIYVNDDDSGGSVATLWDAIRDVSEDLPVAPQVTASYSLTDLRRVGDRLYRANVQFYGDVADPDSETHDFAWDFGDSTFSAEQNPSHEFLVEANYSYTVSLVATDPDGYAGSDTCQVGVEQGFGELPITVNFVGDIMIGRTYENNGGIIDTYGVDAIFEPTYGILDQAADLSVANLEVPFTDQGTPHPTKSVVFRAKPENLVGVANAGIDVVTLGNNHIIDYGEPGLVQTQELLDQYEIRHSGAGVTDYFALLPTYWTERGLRLAFLGQCNRTGRQWNYQPYLDAGASKPGFGYFLPQNMERSIDYAREHADVVILQSHSGPEYQTEPPERGGRDLPAMIEANEILESDPDFSFRIEPTPGDRELRRMGIDLGADVLINHHPHVLQGFESYQGKLIAHSLGNFIFDLYYPETMPTIVLTLEIDEEGIQGYTFTPAWIDDYITQPAVGQLGREIMDRMADYSRPMGALVATDPEAARARIFLDPAAAEGQVHESLGEMTFIVEEGYALGEPVRLEGNGTLSRIVELMGENLGDWEISFGREILWHGGFEDEGATFWYNNTDDEWLDETESLEGLRSLALRRQHNSSGEVGTDLEKHLPCDPTLRHSFTGAIKGQNTEGANIRARFYNSRTASTPISSTDLGAALSGDFDWLDRWLSLDTPETGTYFELRCTMQPPADGEAMAWYDELKMIEWDEWQAGGPDMEVPHPNNYRFVQIRSMNTGLAAATLRYEETGYAAVGTGAPVETPAAAAVLLRPYPNPFNPATTLTLVAPSGAGRVDAKLTIYDLRGRRLVTIFDGSIERGTRRVFTWRGRDDRGRSLSSGIYFARAKVGSESASTKLILLK